jgi:hypothetical protein
MNERYHKMIADKLLANQLKMIKNTQNPTMFENELKSLSHLHDDVILYGGIRPSKYVQSGNNIASFDPSSLATGKDITNKKPEQLLDENGGSLRLKNRGRRVKESGGNIYDTMGEVAKTVAPIALRYGLPMMMGLGLDEKKKKRGRPKKVIEQAQPVLTAKEIVQKTKGSGLRKKKQGGDFLSTLKSIGNYIKPVAETVGKDVILPVAMDVGKQALKSYLTKGAGMSGGGTKRSNPRALIVKKIMKEKGLSLIEASKYVKANNLY